MRIRIKDLKPNPFRDMKNYPINEQKVKSLTNSINQTGFWDNILARPKPNHTFMTEKIIDSDEEYDQPEYMHIIYDENGEEEDYDDPIFEIAYGHHRLVALKKLFKPDDYVDIPVKELDDSTMIRIMANENDENWGTSPTIVDETVRVVREYLVEHIEVIKTKNPVHGQDCFYSKEAFQISEFLNGNWIESRVNFSLERIKAEETEETHEKHIDKEAIESYPTERSARNFVKAVKQIKNITPEQQRNVAKRMIENQSFGESAIKSELLHEKYKDKKTVKDKEEHDFIEFKDFILECTKDMKRLNEKLEQLFILKTKLKFDFEKYSDSTEAKDFDCETRILIDCLIKLLGKEGKENVKNKLLQISD